MPLDFGYDTSGDAYPSLLNAELTLTASKWTPCHVLEFPTGADIFVEGDFIIPGNYASTPAFVIQGVLDGTPSNVLAFSASQIARIAGAPECKGAGIYLYKHVRDKAKKGELLFTIYAHNKIKLQFAKEALFKLNPIVIS